MADGIEVKVTAPATPAEAPVTAPQRPEDVPEQFWDAEKGAVNTEALLAAVKAQNAASGEPEAEAAGDEGNPEADALAAEAGIDVPAVEAHFLEHGEIPADTYEKAAKIGVSKEMVDEFVQYRVSQADRIRDEMLQPYGGEQTVSGMVEWAGKNWTAEQANAFNESVNSGDRGKIDLALRSLKADFDKKNGVKPALLKPSTGNPAAGGVFRSFAELTAAQRDPRYKTDPAYRDEVIAKLSRSSI